MTKRRRAPGPGSTALTARGAGSGVLPKSRLRRYSSRGMARVSRRARSAERGDGWRDGSAAGEALDHRTQRRDGLGAGVAELDLHVVGAALPVSIERRCDRLRGPRDRSFTRAELIPVSREGIPAGTDQRLDRAPDRRRVAADG